MSTNGSKKAISSFFAKQKAKRTDGNHISNTNITNSSSSTSNGHGDLSLPISGTAAIANALKLSEYSSLLGDGKDGGWVTEVPEEEPVIVESISSSISQQLKIVDKSDDYDENGELNETDNNDNTTNSTSNVGTRVNIAKLSYADSAHKNLENEGTSSSNNTTAATPAPVTTTAPVVASWGSARAEARKQAEKANAGDWAEAGTASKLTKGPNVNSINDFPTLPGQQVPETVSGIKKPKSLADLGTANRFGAFDNDDDDDDVTPAANTTTTTNNNVYRPPIGRVAGSTTNTGNTNKPTVSTGLVEGTGKVLSTPEQVKEETCNILKELQNSADTVEALRRFLEMNTQPLSLRKKAVEELLRFAMEETSKLMERMHLGKVLLSFVPSRFITVEMLHAGVGRFSYLFDDLRLDAGKDAVRDVAQVLGTGVVEGTLRNSSSTTLVNMTPVLAHVPTAVQNEGYVPITYIHPLIAKEISVQNNNKLDRVLSKAGTLAPKDDNELDAGVTTTSNIEDTPKPNLDTQKLTTSASTNSLIGGSTPSMNTPNVDDDDDEFVTVTSKKKKKKGGKGKAFVEED